MNGHPNPVYQHGDVSRQPTHCRCQCRTCDERRAAYPAEIEKLMNPPPTAAELEEQRQEQERQALIRQQARHREEIRARVQSPEYQAEKRRIAKANFEYYQRCWEAEQNRYDVMTIYRPTINRSSIDGKHDFTTRGTVAEQVAAVEKLVQLRAVEFGLFVFERYLCELDFSFSPPARRITRSAALKELLTRIIRQCLAEDDDGKVKPALWRFTEEADMEPAEPDDIWPETLTQLVAAGRWIAPAIPARQLPPGPVYEELVPALVDQLRTVALEAGGRWCGTKAALAELTGFDSVQLLTAELARLAPQLVSRNITVAKTGRRLPPVKSWEWAVEIPEQLVTSSPSSLPGQDGDDGD
jgi:hypothetical protein